MKNISLLAALGVVLILIVLNNQPENNKPTSSTPPSNSTAQKSSYITATEYNKIRQAEIATNANNNLILFGFRLKMTPPEYRAKKRALIQSGQLQLWDDKNYCASLFSIEETIEDKHFGRYTIPNYARVELRYEPVFIGDKLVSWELPVWFDLSDNASNYSRSSDNLQNMVDYLSSLYGKPIQQESSHYYWINGNLEVRVSIKTVSKPPYGSEAIPVITYQDNSYFLNK